MKKISRQIRRKSNLKVSILRAQSLESFLIVPTDFPFKLLAGIVTLFVILDPIGTLPFFQGFTSNLSSEQRKILALRSVLIGMGVLLIFAYLGSVILSVLWIVSNDFIIAGGLFTLDICTP